MPTFVKDLLDRKGRDVVTVGPEVSIGEAAGTLHAHKIGSVVVTDAEIFGRYKIQRPRRLKSPHAAAARSALEIDFSELE